MANATTPNIKQDNVKIQKAAAAAGGFALVALVVTPVGKRVFLLVVTTVMRGMTPAATTVKKRPLAVQKVRLWR